VRAMEVCVAENINSGTISILPCFPPQSSEPVVRVTEEKFTHFLFYPLVALGDTVTLTKALAAIVAEFPLRHPPSSPPGTVSARLILPFCTKHPAIVTVPHPSLLPSLPPLRPHLPPWPLFLRKAFLFV
jgi:hypothetical protein